MILAGVTPGHLVTGAGGAADAVLMSARWRYGGDLVERALKCAPLEMRRRVPPPTRSTSREGGRTRSKEELN